MSQQVESVLSTQTALLDDASAEYGINDVVDEDQTASDDEADGVVSSTSPTAVLSPNSTGRIFMVERVTRSTGGHRPHFLFEGKLVDIMPTSTGHRLQYVEPSKDLSLSLRYEPPSPKFSRSCPEMTSYRLKLLQGTQFIYLLRGLPRVLILDHPARAVGWGVLQLVFSTTQQLECFLAVLRHVTIVPDQLWPRHITSLWRPVISEPGADPAQHTNPQSVQQDTPQQPALIRSPRHTDTHSEPHTRHLPARTSHKEQLHTPVFAAGPHGHGEGHQEWFGSYVRWAVDNRWLVGGLVVAAGAALWLSGYRSQARAA